MLRFELTDLDGNEKWAITRHLGGEVVIPWCDSLTAKITVNVYDKAASYITPLDTMLRVYLDDLPLPIFWGVILTPMWKGNTVEVNAHDQSIWWKRNYHRYGDPAVDIGYPISGKGLRTLVESAIPLSSQLGRGIPHPGIIWGTDNATGFKLVGGVYVDGNGPRPANLKAPKAGDGLWTIATRGQNVYDSVQALQEIDGGPEWRLRPDDTLAAGYYARLDTSRRFGVDRTDQLEPVHFHEGGGGKQTCENFAWTPDGNAVRNYWVEVFPGGEDNRADSKKKGLAHSEASWLQYGIYQGWESSRNQDPNSVLVARAKQRVRYYKFPPNYFSFDPKPENAPRFKHDYDLGDTIRGSKNTGHYKIDLKGRVRAATLTQMPKKLMTTALTCVPDIPGAESTGDPGG